MAAARDHLADVVDTRSDAERAEAEEERRLGGLLRAAADRREGLARLAGQVAARRSRVEAGQEQVDRLVAQIGEAQERAAVARAEFEALESQVEGAEAGEEGLDAEHEAAAADLAQVEEELADAARAERDAEQERATWAARREALELGLKRRDGGGALLAAGEQLSGLLGSVAALLTVQPGHENAVAAALGVAADAVAVESPSTALAALRLLKADDGGQASVVVAGAPALALLADPAGPPPAPGARWARSLVQAPVALATTLDRLLDGVAVVPDLDSAAELVAAQPALTAVTLEGDVVAAGLVRGGSASAPSLLEVQAAVDEAEDTVAAAPGGPGRRGAGWRQPVSAAPRASSGSRPRWNGCTTPTPGWPRWGNSWGSSVRRRAPRRPRRAGCARHWASRSPPRRRPGGAGGARRAARGGPGAGRRRRGALDRAAGPPRGAGDAGAGGGDGGAARAAHG